jgi:hypothetical protein
MSVMMLLVTLIFIFLACGFSLLFVRLSSRDRLSFPPEDWEGIFSPTRYHAMERLLDDTDAEFLRSHRLFDRKAQKAFRSSRIRLFRGYMHQLSADFGRICKALKVLMVHSHVDRPDLAGLIMKQQFTFSLAMMTLEVKLTLYGFGWTGVDAKAVMEPLADIRAQLQVLAAIAEPSFASSAA